MSIGQGKVRRLKARLSQTVDKSEPSQIPALRLFRRLSLVKDLYASSRGLSRLLEGPKAVWLRNQRQTVVGRVEKWYQTVWMTVQVSGDKSVLWSGPVEYKLIATYDSRTKRLSGMIICSAIYGQDTRVARPSNLTIDRPGSST